MKHSKRVIALLLCFLMLASTFLIGCSKSEKEDPTADQGDGTLQEVSDGLSYRLNEDGSAYTVTGIGVCKDSAISIPTTHNGKPVTAIAASAFSQCDTLTSVRIPNSIKNLGEKAFYWCKNLERVTIGSSVTDIKADTFAYCYKLSSIAIPDSVQSIDEKAFYDCDSLTSVTLGNGVKTIGKNAFFACTNLTSVKIGNGVKTIGENAFFGCYRLAEVINKSSLSIVKGSKDYAQVALYALEVHNGDSKIINQDDFLFYTVGGTNYLLSYVGKNTAITLPASFEDQSYAIYRNAFRACNSLTSITLSDNVTSIGELSLASCEALKSVTVGKNVTNIVSYAFYGCPALTAINYRGTEENWNNIKKGNNWDKDNGTYTLTFNYTGE